MKSLRSRMIFGEHDLGARAPFPRIDLILCRNVLIYFNLPMQRAALETFGFSLRDDGRLVLGPSETVAAMPGGFVEDNARMRVYRRAPGTAPLPLTPGKTPRMPRDHEAQLSSAIRTTRRDVQVAAESTEAAEALLLDLGLGVVVVDLRYYITQDQHRRPADARDPRPRVRPGLHPSRRVAPLDRRPGRDRRRVHGTDDGRPSTRSRVTTSRPTAPASSRSSCGRTSGNPSRSRARSSS